MAVCFQERLFEGYMNVGVDNYFRNTLCHQIYLDMPSQRKEKTEGYDVNFGDILFLQYKTIEYRKSTGIYTQKLAKSQYKVLEALEKKYPCSVFYVFPYNHVFDIIRKDFFDHTFGMFGTRMLEKAIFLPIYEINNIPLSSKSEYSYEYNIVSKQITIDSKPVNNYFNFYTWTAWRGYQKYSNKQKDLQNFCPKCPSNPTPLPSRGRLSLDNLKYLLRDIYDAINAIDIVKEYLPDDMKEESEAILLEISRQFDEINSIDKFQSIERIEDYLKEVQSFLQLSEYYFVVFFNIKMVFNFSYKKREYPKES